MTPENSENPVLMPYLTSDIVIGIVGDEATRVLKNFSRYNLIRKQMGGDGGKKPEYPVDVLPLLLWSIMHIEEYQLEGGKISWKDLAEDIKINQESIVEEILESKKWRACAFKISEVLGSQGESLPEHLQPKNYDVNK